jgi:hypothetical protein
MKGKFIPYLISGAVSVGPGCTTLQKIGDAIEYRADNLKHGYDDEKTVSPWSVTQSELDELGARGAGEVRFWPQGYKTLKRHDIFVKQIAGIQAGTIEVRKSEDGRYVSSGRYAWDENVIIEALHHADADGNRLVRGDELWRYLKEVQERHAK